MELNSPIFSVLAGALCGIISGFGIGGGSILMIWMTAIIMIEQRASQAINLLYFIPTSLGALISHIRNKMIAWDIVWPAVIGGCIAAMLSSAVASSLSVNFLRKLFGLFLLTIGIKEILYKHK